jgi:hypothetical protein
MMQYRYMRSMIMVAAAAASIGAMTALSVTPTSGQSPPARPATVGGHPNLSGIWQANNEANWDLQACRAPRRGHATGCLSL